MITGLILLILSWVSFILFANKKMLFKIIPTCLLAIVLALLSDHLIYIYPLWSYGDIQNLVTFLKQFMNATGIYPITTYLFIQTLPKIQSKFNIMKHIFIWSTFGIIIEIIGLKLHYLEYGLWWSIGHSFLMDILLFLIFYCFYHIQE